MDFLDEQVGNSTLQFVRSPIQPNIMCRISYPSVNVTANQVNCKLWMTKWSFRAFLTSSLLFPSRYALEDWLAAVPAWETQAVHSSCQQRQSEDPPDQFEVSSSELCRTARHDVRREMSPLCTQKCGATCLGFWTTSDNDFLTHDAITFASKIHQRV